MQGFKNSDDGRKPQTERSKFIVQATVHLSWGFFPLFFFPFSSFSFFFFSFGGVGGEEEIWGLLCIFWGRKEDPESVMWNAELE